MRTAVAAVLVGCVSAMAHADRPTLPPSALASSSEPAFRIVQVSRQFDQPILAQGPAPASEASITPGAVALAAIALAGFALGAIPRPQTRQTQQAIA